MTEPQPPDRNSDPEEAASAGDGAEPAPHSGASRRGLLKAGLVAGAAVANANPMLDMLDLTSPAFLKPPALAEPLLTAHPIKTLVCDVTGPGTIPPPGSVSPPPA